MHVIRHDPLLVYTHWALRIAQWSAHPSLSVLREDDQCAIMACIKRERSVLLLSGSFWTPVFTISFRHSVVLLLRQYLPTFFGRICCFLTYIYFELSCFKEEANLQPRVLSTASPATGERYCPLCNSRYRYWRTIFTLDSRSAFIKSNMKGMC